MFNEICNDSCNDINHDKHLSDLRRQNTFDLFFSRASILHPNLFRTTCEALKHHKFDRLLHPPANSRHSHKVSWMIYPGLDFKTEHDSAIDLITEHHSKNPGTLSSTAASTPQAGPSAVGITSLGSQSYNSSFIPPPDLPSATVQAQASGTLTTSALTLSAQDLFQNNALNQYNAAIRQLMRAYSQLQLTNPMTAGALPVPPVVPAQPALSISLSGPASQLGIPTIPLSNSVPPIIPSSMPVYVPPQHSTNYPTVAP